MPTDQILYSDKYNDDLFEYRYSSKYFKKEVYWKEMVQIIICIFNPDMLFCQLILPS